MTRRDSVRLSRMREVWHRDAPSDFELRTARQRYLERSHVENRAHSRPRSLLFEFGLGLGFAAVLLIGARFIAGLSPSDDDAAVAANGVSAPQDVATTSTSAAHPPALAERQHADEGSRTHDGSGQPDGPQNVEYQATIERGGEAVRVSPGTPYVVPQGERVVVRLGTETKIVEGPSVIEFQLDPSRASGISVVSAYGSA